MSVQQLSNAALFQVTWFACVLGGAAGQPIWGYLGVAALLGLALRQPTVRGDLLLVAGLGIVGFGLDTLWIELGVLDYQGAWFAPGWIIALWLGFALTVNHSLAWLQAKPLLAGAVAGLAAPISYLGGERLGAVEVTSTAGLGLIAIAWGVVFYLVFAAAGRLTAAGNIWLRVPFGRVAGGPREH